MPASLLSLLLSGRSGRPRHLPRPSLPVLADAELPRVHRTPRLAPPEAAGRSSSRTGASQVAETLQKAEEDRDRAQAVAREVGERLAADRGRDRGACDVHAREQAEAEEKEIAARAVEESRASRRAHPRRARRPGAVGAERAHGLRRRPRGRARPGARREERDARRREAARRRRRRRASPEAPDESRRLRLRAALRRRALRGRRIARRRRGAPAVARHGRPRPRELRGAPRLPREPRGRPEGEAGPRRLPRARPRRRPRSRRACFERSSTGAAS